MSSQFCKIGTIKANHSKTLDLKTRYRYIIEKAYNISMTDASLSDILYHEAFKIRKLLFNLKHNKAAF